MPSFRPFAGTGTLSRTIELSSDSGHAGVVITPDGSLLLVTNNERHCVTVLDVHRGTAVQEFGTQGAGRLEFDEPQKLCCSSDGKVIIADSGNKRLQEVTVTGEYCRFIGSGSFDGQAVHAVACDGVHVVAGKGGPVVSGSLIYVFAYSSGAYLRRLGRHGDELGCCSGLRFLPSVDPERVEHQIIVADCVQGNTTVFELDGTMVKRLTDGVSGLFFDIDVVGEDQLLVVTKSQEVRLLHNTALAPLIVNWWGGKGSGPGTFEEPTAIAIGDGVVYVLDAYRSVLQVYY